MAFKRRPKVTMSHIDNAQRFALMVKKGRQQKNCTQRELSTATGISLRSVQRIENAEVQPRAYTVRVLSEYLAIEGSDVLDVSNSTKISHSYRRLYLSIGVSLLLLIIAIAYVLQSSTFPETTFEFTLYIGAFLLFYLWLLYKIWR